MDDIKIFFSKNIFFLRTNQGLTQTQFGKEFGLLGSQISNYEADDSYPPLLPAIKICKKLNYGLDELILTDLFPDLPFDPKNKPKERVRISNPYEKRNSTVSLVSAATESPPMERDVGKAATESPPPKDTEIVKDVGKEEIQRLRRQAIETLQRLEALEASAIM